MPKELLDRSMSDNETDWPVFSYSQFTVWDRCQQKWWYSYNDLWTLGKTSEGLEVGSIVHEIADMYYTAKVANLEFPVGNVDTYLQSLMPLAYQSDSMHVIKRAGISAHRYVEEYAPINDVGHIFKGSEVYVVAPFTTQKGRNFYLQAYIDLLSEYKGTLKIWDHKTIGRGMFFKPGQLRMAPQPRSYCLALRAVGEKVPSSAIYNMFNTYDYKGTMDVPLEKMFKREDFIITDQELNTHESHMKRKVDWIFDVNVPLKAFDYTCEYCQFLEPCNSSVHKVDPTPLFIKNYKKKEQSTVQKELLVK